MSDIVMLSGSPATPSRSQHLLDVAEKALAARGYAVHRIDVRRLPAQALLHGERDAPAIRAALAAVQAARGVVIATPLYKASYSGALKTLLDLLPQNAFEQKPVLPLATGGSLAHLLALDYALKPVLMALGARWLLDNVFAVESDMPKGEAGYLPNETLTRRLTEGVDGLARALEERDALARLAGRTERERVRAVG